MQLETKIFQLPDRGKIKSQEELIAKTSEEIPEMMKIKVIGQKIFFIIWKEMETENVGELLYALPRKLFGRNERLWKKNQQNVFESIAFYHEQKINIYMHP